MRVVRRDRERQSNNDDIVNDRGNPTIVCQFCSALRWKDKCKTLCCSNGKVKLDDIIIPPEPLNSLLNSSHVRTVQNVIYDTFQGACNALGLLDDESHWENTLSEAFICCTPKLLRCLFTIMLTICQITDPLMLWQNYHESMADNILHRKRQELSSNDISFDQSIFDEALFELNKEVINSNYYLTSSVNNDEGKILFLDALGGTGKTFLINLLLAKVRYGGKIALAVASSGIAATLLVRGRTAHSTFKLPLKYDSDDTTSVCNVSKQSGTGKLMQDCSLIIWDKASMSQKTSVEALDRTMRDLRHNNSPMGGCTVLFFGDFHQILPVVTRADEVNASLKRSYYEFQATNDKINIKSFCNSVPTITKLIQNVYPNILNISSKSLKWFQERAILSPTNEQIDKLNDLILSRLDAQSQMYYSVDTVLEKEVPCWQTLETDRENEDHPDDQDDAMGTLEKA
ncbi:PREDICTED: uncharacterized protein LOC107166369 [Diuraphis noxia]|uniref:uncharacterized protein LOC107166369 n=1 Tax=Diuraphis noxia TaxID=143948 RepID=UPI00076378E1|nr:PREDICTED: uncharacterized protein LOC107166369 [Diuraphis noxia]